MERSKEPMTDKELMDGFVRGDEESFDALVQRHKERLFNAAYRVLYDPQAAEDVVQRVFIRLAERRDELADVRSVQAWLYAATLNLSLDVQKTMRRRKEREKAVEDSSRTEGPREVAMRSELRKELDLALAGLKNSLRIPLILRYLQGLSYEETGEVLGLSSEAVRKRVKRGLRALRTLLRARNLALPVAGIKAILRAAPSEAASANFLTSASSILKAASGTAVAAKAAITTTAVVKGGLMMSAKVKIAIGIGAAVLLGTVGYLATRKGDDERGLPRAEEGGPRGKSGVQGGEQGRGALVPAGEKELTDEAERLKGALWGRVVDVEGNPVAEATVEAGVFEGDTVTSLVRKTLVRSRPTDANGVFVFNDRVALSRMAQVLKKRAQLPQKLPGALHGLLIVTKEGCFPTRRQVDFESLGERHDMILKKAPEVTGRVVWAENQEPIEGVKVVCEPEKSDLYHVSEAEGLTDKEGKFALSVPAQGGAKLFPDGLQTWPKPKEPNVDLVPGGRIEEFVFPIELLSDTVLMGRVTNEEGQPVAGAELFLSTEKAFEGIAKTREDGRYMLWVYGGYSYRSYDLEDWPENPKLRASEPDVFLMEYMRQNPDGTWQWMEYWIPPPNAPPERLVAFHRDYEMGIVDVPALGVGQMRENVDVVLSKGAKVLGRVTDQNGVGLEGAAIRVETEPAENSAIFPNDKTFLTWGPGVVKSGRDGCYEINFLREGAYTVSARKGYWEEKKPLEINRNEVVEGFDFVLVHGEEFIKGKVSDERGNPWTHGRVWADSGGGPLLKSDTGSWSEIEQDGSYAINHLEPANYCLWLDASEDYWQGDGLLWPTLLEDVPAGTDGANIIVRMLPGGTLRVRVVDEAQQPVNDYELTCSPLSLSGGRSAIPMGVAWCDKGQYRTFGCDWERSGVLFLRKDVVTDTGEFLITTVAPGRYFVSAKGKKHGSEFKEVEVCQEQESLVLFVLKSLCLVEGMVLDERGQPVEGASIEAMKMRELQCTPERVWIFYDTWGYEYAARDYGPVFSQVSSDEKGRFVCDGLEQGGYRIVATRRDAVIDPYGRWYSAFADVSLDSPGPHFLEFTLRRGTGRIEGCVVGEDGNRNYVQVALIGNGQITRVHSDKRGNYFFEDVLPGRYRLTSEVWGRGRYESREVELKQGERLRLDIVAEGDGGLQGSISLGGEAARAAVWNSGYSGEDHILILRRLREGGSLEGTETSYRVGHDFESFELKNISCGTYEATAYFTLNIKPFGRPNQSFDEFYDLGECRAQFASDTNVIEIAPGSSTPIDLTVSEACAPHYPIPDGAICDNWLFVQELGQSF